MPITNTKLGQEIYQFRKQHLAKIIGLETDPEGEEYMYLIRDGDDNILEGISFSNELDEIVSYIESEVAKEREACENLGT